MRLVFHYSQTLNLSVGLFVEFSLYDSAYSALLTMTATDHQQDKQTDPALVRLYENFVGQTKELEGPEKTKTTVKHRDMQLVSGFHMEYLILNERLTNAEISVWL